MGLVVPQDTANYKHFWCVTSQYEMFITLIFSSRVYALIFSFWLVVIAGGSGYLNCDRILWLITVQSRSL